jgi:nucleoside-diphosphate-sugar epimerase
VRSVASAFYLALTKHKSGRYNIYDGSYDHELIAKIARRKRPDLDKYIPYVAEDKTTPIEQGAYTIDSSKSENELGLGRESPFCISACGTG